MISVVRLIWELWEGVILELRGWLLRSNGVLKTFQNDDFEVYELEWESQASGMDAKVADVQKDVCLPLIDKLSLQQ